MGRLQHIVRQVGIYSIGMIANRGASLLLVPLYSRVMGKAEIADFAICTATLTLVLPAVSLGLSQASVRFFHLHDDEHAQRGVLSSSLLLVTLVSALTAAAFFLFDTRISLLVFQKPGGETLTHLIGLSLAMTALTDHFLSWLRAQQKSTQYVALNFVRAAISPATSAALVLHFDMGVAGVLWGELAGLIALAAAGLVVCAPSLHLAFDGRITREMLAFGLPLVPLGIGTAILTNSDRYFLQDLMGADALAVYDVGFRAAVIIQFATRALQTAYPPVAFHIDKTDPDAAATLGRLARFFFVGIFGIALGLTAFAPEIAAVFAPRDQYASSFQVVPWIAFSLALHCAVLNVMIGLSIMKRNMIATLIVCSAGALKLALNPILIAPFGIVGAAAATLISFVAELALALIVTQRIYPITYEWRRLWTFAGVLAVSASALYAAAWLPLAIGLPLRAILLVAALVALRVLGVFTIDEQRAAMAMLRRRT